MLYIRISLTKALVLCSFNNKPNIFWWFIIINNIYYELFITNNEPATLNWNHSFIWKAKTEGIFKKN